MNPESLSGKKVLVVEDEQHLAVGIKYNLEAEGYQCTAVTDGPQALAEVASANPQFDLIVLDIMLPGMSGYAVCESLRRSGHFMPILMLSARTLTEDRIRGYNAGADHYLQKPFELEELISIARNLLLRSAGSVVGSAGSTSAGNTYEFDGVRVNFDTFEVEVRGEPRRLTSMQMKLLRYFLEHEGIVVTRAELLENVWGLSNMVVSRTVDNFLLDLRKFFEVDPAKPRHFLSVRGIGYRFVAHPDQEGAAAT